MSQTENGTFLGHPQPPNPQTFKRKCPIFSPKKMGHFWDIFGASPPAPPPLPPHSTLSIPHSAFPSSPTLTPPAADQTPPPPDTPTRSARNGAHAPRPPNPPCRPGG